MTEMTETPVERQEHRLRTMSRAGAMMLALVALADFLLFAQVPGLNFFAFAVAIGAGILLLTIGRLPARPVAMMVGVALVLAMPLLEAPSVIGVLLALLGLAMLALVSARLLPRRLVDWPLVLARFAILAPTRFVVDFIRPWPWKSAMHLRKGMARRLVVWVVPGFFALVFLALFQSANPVIAQVLGRLDPWTLTGLLDTGRIALWLLVAMVVWALLRPRLKRWRRRAVAAEAVESEARENLLFGEAAILRSLIVFNGLFAVQTLLDLTYLWGGAALPDGMSHADYAHRGAYPLILTALLAAGFVLAAMRRNGPGETNRLIRVLVYAWIGQNVMLCISSMLRLDLYVEVYTLTEMRIAAGIWMGLVAAGLVLILLRIALRQSNAWLVAMNLATLTAVLYGCAWIDFPAVIARFNVEHSAEMGGEGRQLDLSYLASLGPGALPAFDMYLAEQKRRHPYYAPTSMVRDTLAARFAERSRDWRSWRFRDARLQAYLDGQEAIATSGGNAKN